MSLRLEIVCRVFLQMGLCCALRIFDAATISIALVIFRVFCTLLILVRISFVPGMALAQLRCRRSSSRIARREITTLLRLRLYFRILKSKLCPIRPSRSFTGRRSIWE